MFKPIERKTITAKEAAEYLGVSVDIVYMMVRENELPHVRVGRRILFKVDSLEKWFADKEQEATSDGY